MTQVVIPGGQDTILDDFLVFLLLILLLLGVLEHGGVANLLLFGDFLQIGIDGFDLGQAFVQPVGKHVQMNCTTHPNQPRIKKKQENQWQSKYW